MAKEEEKYKVSEKPTKEEKKENLAIKQHEATVAIILHVLAIIAFASCCFFVFNSNTGFYPIAGLLKWFSFENPVTYLLIAYFCSIAYMITVMVRLFNRAKEANKNAKHRGKNATSILVMQIVNILIVFLSFNQISVYGSVADYFFYMLIVPFAINNYLILETHYNEYGIRISERKNRHIAALIIYASFSLFLYSYSLFEALLKQSTTTILLYVFYDLLLGLLISLLFFMISQIKKEEYAKKIKPSLLIMSILLILVIILQNFSILVLGV